MSTFLNPTAEAARAARGAHPMATRSLPAGPMRRPPTHPGALLADVLEEQGIAPRAAAKAIGMSHTGLVKLLKGLSPVTPASALRLGKWLGNGPDLWLHMQQANDLWHTQRALADSLAKIVPLPGVNVAPATKRRAG